MAFMSPLGLGAQMIGRRRHRKVVKLNETPATSRYQLKPRGQKRSQEFEVETEEKKLRGSGLQSKPHGLKSMHEFEVEDESEEKKVRGSRFQLKPHGQKNRGNFSKFSIFNFSDNQEDIIARQLLSWLPVKSLMRLKSVCKYWCSLIQEDTTFINLHLERSKSRPGLLVANLIENYTKYQIMTGDLVFGGKDRGAISAANFHTIRDIDFARCDWMLRPVFGLTAFFGERRDDPGVCIFNLSTREKTPWIVSNLLRDVRKEDLQASNAIPRATCALGYNPTSKEHKVVGIWRSSKPSYVVCEVLTVGENKWRRIHKVPPQDIELYGSSVYVNGSIYYTTEFLGIFEADEKEKKFIVGFDVGSEKFRAIRVPSYVFEQPENYHSSIYIYNIMLLELDGRLGLFIKIGESGYTPKLWVLDEDRNKKNSTSTWTEVSIQLPYTLGGPRCGFACDPVLGTDQMILTSYVKASGGKISESTCHSYNWKKKTSNAIDFSGISSAPCFSSASKVRSFFESLFPVQKRSYRGSGVDEVIVEDSWKRYVGGD
ncbi:uncharacterized protein LOC113322531 [Papaver somniferum]|uniref:uncharacterized protein LOC113322531 n=1 Tax=Papaver somniferum TaxID=3469 RepID=UPI000E6FB18C|nr:uncharacterized protein LOC113322531 [Papaver somniferum]